MDCLVTGGAGFIGSNLVDALLARGDGVTVVDDLSTGRRENLEPALAAGARLVEADVRDAEALSSVAAECDPEVVFHLAAQIDVRKSVADPAFDATVNVGGTANALEAARRVSARALRLRLDRRRDLRRGRGPAAAAARVGADRADVPLRAEQVRGGGLRLPVRTAARALGGQPAARQRLRPAAGPAGRGGRDRDLLRQAARGNAADRVRRRAPDPRLHICRRRGLRGAGRGGLRGHRRDQRRHRDRDRRDRAGRKARRPGRGRWLRARDRAARARARCSGSRSTRRGPPSGWAGDPRPSSPPACGRRSTLCS